MKQLLFYALQNDTILLGDLYASDCLRIYGLGTTSVISTAQPNTLNVSEDYRDETGMEEGEQSVSF